jgi:flagellar basal-body rod protein FlgF
MSTGIWSAVSGAVAQTMALDVAANNVANANTTGYRADRLVFRQELNRAIGQSMGTQSLRYSLVRTVEPDRTQGSLVRTGRSLDVALRSPNQWFTVTTPAGQRYTRSGSIQVGSDGTLQTSDGHPYTGSGGSPLQVPSEAQTIGVGPNGEIIVDGLESGMRIGVVEFPPNTVLQKEGALLVRTGPGVSAPASVDADLEMACLESSNASPMAGMTSLVQASREFEMISRVIEVFAGLEHRTATDLARK